MNIQKRQEFIERELKALDKVYTNMRLKVKELEIRDKEKTALVMTIISLGFSDVVLDILSGLERRHHESYIEDMLTKVKEFILQNLDVEEMQRLKEEKR